MVTYSPWICAHNATYPLDIDGGSVDAVSALGWQDQLKFILGGTSGNDFALARFDQGAAGFDATFGVGGCRRR